MSRPTEETIFDFARRIDSQDLRAEYLTQACNGDAEVLARVRALLQVHDQQAEFLESPPAALETVDHDKSDRIGLVVDNYKLMEQIGEGGMGVVYVAEQQHPVRRRVALKVIKPGMDSKEILARFTAERQALAMMDHPNIAKVHDAGTTESGHPYFVMELVRGIPITEYCDLHRFSLSQRLQLFVDVCHAAQHAHQKGVIHRDLKPSNVLVTEHDGTPVAKVIDFGVAKAINQQLTDLTIYTQFQQMVGTPLYMSPEQAELSGLDVDTRSDIYSLGVLLFELLTGTTPFDKDRLQQAAMDEVRRIIREEEPSKPSTKIRSLGKTAATVSGFRSTDPNRLSQSLSGDLDWIIMKSLEKDRNRRYDTAKDLAADILRHVNDEPVTARPPSPAYKLKKLVRRNKVAFVTGLVVAASLLIGLCVAALGWQHASQNHKNAEAAKLAAQAAAGKLERQQYLNRIRNADDAIRRNRLSLAEYELDRCPVDRRGWEWSFLDNLQKKFVTTLEATERPCFSKDGRRVTAIGVNPDIAHVAKTWDYGSREVLQTYDHDRQLTFITISPDESLLAGGDTEGNLTAWRYGTGERLWSLKLHNDRVTGVAFSPDGESIATSSGDNDPAVKVINVETQEVERELGPYAMRLYGVAFSPDGRWIVTSTHINRDEPAKAFFINMETGAQSTLKDDRGQVFLPTFDPTGKSLATSHAWQEDGIYRHAIKLWRWNDGSPVEVALWPTQDEFIRCLAFSPDGEKLVSGSYSRRIKTWEVQTGDEIVSHYDLGPIYQLSFHPSGEAVASYSRLATDESRIRFWPIGERHTGILTKPLSRQTMVRFRGDGGSVVVGSPVQFAPNHKDESFGEDLVVLDASSGTEIHRHSGQFYAPSWSADGSQVIASSPGSMCGFDAVSGKATFRHPTERADICKTLFVDQLGRRTTFFSDTAVNVKPPTNGREKAHPSFLSENEFLTAAQLSPNTRHFAVGVSSGPRHARVAVWDTAKASVTTNIETPDQFPTAIAFLHHQDGITVGFRDGTISSFDLRTGEMTGAKIINLGDSVRCLAVSPDGSQLVAATADEVGVWDLASRRPMLTLSRGRTATSLDWSSDRKRIVAGYNDGSVQIWTLPSVH